jgi:predicted alpha/beta hydrolase family esterase
MNYTLIVPELGDSVKERWQNYWLTKYETPKVIQNDGRPVLSDWLQNLNSAITAIDGKIILCRK